MMKTFLMGTAAASVLLTIAATAANADARHGWYVNVELGAVQVDDTGLPGIPGFQDIEYSTGWGAIVGFGHAFNNRWRMEIEGGHRNNEADTNNGFPANNGELTEWTGMLNVVYDAPMSDSWQINLGLGAGFDLARYDDKLGREGNETKTAAQGIVGLTYRVSDHWDMSLTYRYLWAQNPEFVLSGIPTDMDISKHMLSIGFRGYDDPPASPPALAAPPPPPPPPPQAKQFVIFFGFNKCNITAEADAVLSEAAASAKSMGSASVRIVGHTDSVGSNDYNQKLSECRADATKSNLVGKGVAEGAISTSGKGEAELMVQTGDGVKEPQNRRATVNVN